jgi:diketogulonate reductase-like aldo/keto reductase
MTGDTATRKLADGNEIPLLGLGVWQVKNAQECVDAVRWALELGYRHIDTAQAYGNEEAVGRGIRESGVPREDVFITTKFYPRNKDPLAAVQQSLERLGTDWVDLYITHWPEGGPTWAWPGMEQAREAGHARSIGVSNFSVEELTQLLEVASAPPVVNQVQFSPYEFRKGLLDWSNDHAIALEAYSPLGTGKHLRSGAAARIAERHVRTPAQVLIRWCLERDVIVIPKSVHRERIEENGAVFDFELSGAEMAELDALDTTGGTERARESVWWR